MASHRPPERKHVRPWGYSFRFARIDQGWPDDANPPYRFMTTADWSDMESFKNGFYAPAVQESLQENLKMLKEPVFLISEILIYETKEDIL